MPGDPNKYYTVFKKVIIENAKKVCSKQRKPVPIGMIHIFAKLFGQI